MATADMQRLIDDLRGDVPGLVLTTLQANIFKAVDDFLDFTNVWTTDVDVVLVTNQRTYTLDAPVQGRYNRLAVLFDSQDLDENWVDRAQFENPLTLKVHSTPTAGPTWVARMAMRLATVDGDNNPDLPDAVIQKYREALYNGTRRYLHAMPQMPWSDMKLAGFYGQLFLSQKTTARVDKIKANVVGQTNWAYPQPYGRGRQRGF